MSDRNRPIKVLIIGAAGMIGRKLTARLLADGRIGSHDLDELVLADIVMPREAETPRQRSPPSPAISPGRGPPPRSSIPARSRLPPRGHRLGRGGSRFRQGLPHQSRWHPAVVRGDPQGRAPREAAAGLHLVDRRLRFPFPELIGDDFLTAPLTSYGTQKAICELLLSDYTRRGFFDGIGIRLPTICVRPGLPNKAASGFFSSIIREPLVGKEAVLPVDETVRHSHASPRAAVAFLLHAATIDLDRLGTRRNLSMPGLSVTVGEQIEALRRVAGDAAVRRIRHEPDPLVERIVAGWPRSFAAGRAQALGFTAETSFDDIVRIHIEDELGGRLP